MRSSCFVVLALLLVACEKKADAPPGTEAPSTAVAPSRPTVDPVASAASGLGKSNAPRDCATIFSDADAKAFGNYERKEISCTEFSRHVMLHPVGKNGGVAKINVVASGKDGYSGALAGDRRLAGGAMKAVAIPADARLTFRKGDYVVFVSNADRSMSSADQQAWVKKVGALVVTRL